MSSVPITIKILPLIKSKKDRSKLTEKEYAQELSFQTKKLEKVITEALKD